MSDLKYALDEFSRVPTEKTLEDVLYAAAKISDVHLSWIDCALSERRRWLEEHIESRVLAAVEETENTLYSENKQETETRIKQVLEKIRSCSEDNAQDLKDTVCKLFSEEFSLF